MVFIVSFAFMSNQPIEQLGCGMVFIVSFVFMSKPIDWVTWLWLVQCFHEAEKPIRPDLIFFRCLNRNKCLDVKFLQLDFEFSISETPLKCVNCLVTN